MPYTPPAAGSSSWDVPLNEALADIHDEAVAAQTTANDALAGGGQAVPTEQDTTSTSWTDLATPGPSTSVTVSTARTVLVFLKAQIVNTTTADDIFMSFTATGATTVSALDSNALRHNGTGTADAGTAVAVVLVGPGTTTFTAKYRTDGGNARFSNRVIATVVT